MAFLGLTEATPHPIRWTIKTSIFCNRLANRFPASKFEPRHLAMLHIISAEPDITHTQLKTVLKYAGYNTPDITMRKYLAFMAKLGWIHSRKVWHNRMYCLTIEGRNFIAQAAKDIAKIQIPKYSHIAMRRAWQIKYEAKKRASAKKAASQDDLTTHH